MTICYTPLSAWKDLNCTITFKEHEGIGNKISIPCGQCLGCRLERSRQWATRCVHEAQCHTNNCFITLTYNDENLPKNNSLILSDLQKFFKRFRKAIAPQKIKFFACGEYGDKNDRPHYHAIIFGYDFREESEKNKINELKQTDYGVLYTSSLLDKCWKKGHTSVAECSFDTAAYVARYCVKKVTGENATYYYNGRKPEFATMSRREAIGKKWLQKFYTDVYTEDKVKLNGKSLKVPPYYDKWLEKNEPEIYELVKLDREDFADKPEETISRLHQKHRVALHNTKNHTRALEGLTKINPRDANVKHYRDTIIRQYGKEHLS